jgi:hypothetical protein
MRDAPALGDPDWIDGTGASHAQPDAKPVTECEHRLQMHPDDLAGASAGAGLLLFGRR